MATGNRNYDLNLGNLTNGDYRDIIIHWGQVINGPEDDPSGAGRCKVFIREVDRELFNLGINEKDFLKNPESYGDLVGNLP